MTKRPSPSDIQESAGLVGGLIKQVRLAWRLFRDSRVPGWVKMIPIGGLLYLLSPIDLLPDLALPGLGQIDDAVLIMLALKTFVDLSPPGIVREHLEQLFGGPGQPQEPSSGTYIDAPYHLVDKDEE